MVHGCDVSPQLAHRRFQAAAAPSQSTCQVTPQLSDWESRKHAIEDLYLGRNLPVDDVIEIMKKAHGFSAT